MFTTRIMGNLTAELMTSNDVAQDAYNYTSGDSRRSTNRFTSSFSAYSGRSLLSATSNLSRSTGYYPSSGSAISTVGTASGSGQYSLAGTNAVASSFGQISGQRGGLPPFSPISETDSPSTAVDESHPFWSSSSKCKSPVSPLSNETAVMEEDRWKEAENGEVAIEMVRLDSGDAPPPPEERIN
ncbi:hypothetical protein SCHPADRAFT_926733 [Schizopora paradoxa]|uniref:Uncharacterized protein n=1 Tax=Schizopora paradoxa TaxID=27342 RepID=A0A0H2SGA3_9AGAM|nr:hypothetical protein SCHPADRAFT_926733 [Schizopora paradoxa]